MGARPTALKRTVTIFVKTFCEGIRFVLEGVEAWDRAVVASRGRAERIILEERFWGIEGADSSGIIALMSAIEHGVGGGTGQDEIGIDNLRQSSPF